jgi:hypothetical protein
MLDGRELEKIDDEALCWSGDLKEADVAFKGTERSSFGIDSNNRVPGHCFQGLFQGGGRSNESEGRPAQIDLPRSPVSVVAGFIQRQGDS